MSDSMPAERPLLTAEGVGKFFAEGRVQALADISIEIRAGEYVALCGPSGSGKSTLLNLLGALDQPTEGQVSFRGQPLAGMPRLDHYRSQHIGFVFQSFHLLPVLTALENVQVPMFETPRTASHRAASARELLEVVGVHHRLDHLPSQLSVGERQRVAIARALANEPEVLLADEPTGNLDSVTASEIVALFARLHAQRGVTIVMVTHDAALAGQAARTIRLRDGRLEV